MDVFIRSYLGDRRDAFEEILVASHIPPSDESWKEFARADTSKGIKYILNARRDQLQKAHVTDLRRFAEAAWANVAMIYQLDAGARLQVRDVLEAARSARARGEGDVAAIDLIVDTVDATLGERWNVTSYTQLPVRLLRRRLARIATQLEQKAVADAFPYDRSVLEAALDKAMPSSKPWDVLYRELRIHPVLALVLIRRAMNNDLDDLFRSPDPEYVGIPTAFTDKMVTARIRSTIASADPTPTAFIETRADGMYVDGTRVSEHTPSTLVLFPSTNILLTTRGTRGFLWRYEGATSLRPLAEFPLNDAPQWTDAHRDEDWNLLVLWGGRAKDGRASWAEVSVFDTLTLSFSEASEGQGARVLQQRLHLGEEFNYDDHGNVLGARVTWVSTRGADGLNVYQPQTDVGYDDATIHRFRGVNATAVWGVPRDFFVWEKRNRVRLHVLEGRVVEKTECASARAIAPVPSSSTSA